MSRKDYELYKWYQLTDDEYWVDYDYQNEFQNCQTIICDTQHIDGIKHCILPL